MGESCGMSYSVSIRFMHNIYEPKFVLEAAVETFYFAFEILLLLNLAHTCLTQNTGFMGDIMNYCKSEKGTCMYKFLRLIINVKIKSLSLIWLTIKLHKHNHLIFQNMNV